ncbi:MAG: lipopolysaccharide transport system ATP-binding protein [Luteibaculaceae bacterium]|jgi:lipopolysaccharide transport system ATP-binding protein
MKKAIVIEGLGKKYQTGEFGSASLAADLKRFSAKIRGKENPLTKIGEGSYSPQDFWALRNLNLEISEGEIWGVLGKNGAGKSTLLKILSRVTIPTEGSIRIQGKLASLLEVGTGFHPEMTGRENIFMNGVILGMKRKDIQRQLDEIVDFAGVGPHLDTPVKRYSSGMYIRLGFAVAAHLNPDILIVDEVLAVGDAEFQKKAIGKMKDVSTGQGRTVLFVSHNMGSIKSLCNKGLFLDKGQMGFQQSFEIDHAIQAYVGLGEFKLGEPFSVKKEDYEVFLLKWESENYEVEGVFSEDEPFSLLMDFVCKRKLERFGMTFCVSDAEGLRLFSFSTKELGIKIEDGKRIKLKFDVPAKFMNFGEYTLSLHFVYLGANESDIYDQISPFKVVIGKREIGHWMGKEPGLVRPKLDWTKKILS